MRVRLSHAATTDLNTLYKFSKAHFGERKAVAFLNTFYKIFHLISTNPLMGRNRDEIKPLARSVVCNKHIIFYCIADNKVEILRIIHGNMDVSHI